MNRVIALHGGGFSVVHPQGGSLGTYATRGEAEAAAQADADIIATVDAWYDRHTRSWVIQRKNAAGDQLGQADYLGSRTGMKVIRTLRELEIGKHIDAV